MKAAEMNIISQQNKNLLKVEDVIVPDVFYRRFKTGAENLDFAYGGEGFLPGMVFTLAGSPGAGKTTLLLQTLEMLVEKNVNSAYFSGEESIYQLAFAARRLNLKKTKIANLQCIEEIFRLVESEKLQMIILDSFPSLATETGLSGEQKEKYITNFITKEAKRLEVAVGIVLHFTKTGSYKGSTLLPHCVDANMILTINKEDNSLRDLEVTKNRFGRAGVTTFSMFENGFNFSETRYTEVNNTKLPVRSKLELAKNSILEFLAKNKKITAADIGRVINNIGAVQRTAKDLVNAGILKKIGRGAAAYWKKC